MLAGWTDTETAYGRDCSQGCRCARDPECNLGDSAWTGGYRQLGSQISRFHVDCEIGRPVRIGYIQAKFVITRAT